MAVQGVWCEPVSGDYSLFAWEFTGKYVKTRHLGLEIGRNSDSISEA